MLPVTPATGCRGSMCSSAMPAGERRENVSISGPSAREWRDQLATHALVADDDRVNGGEPPAA
jgi:hypothetical protein